MKSNSEPTNDKLDQLKAQNALTLSISAFIEIEQSWKMYNYKVIPHDVFVERMVSSAGFLINAHAQLMKSQEVEQTDLLELIKDMEVNQ